jgi:hypothetical protein
MINRKRWSARYRPGRRRKVRQLETVCLLLDVFHPQFAREQQWYVEKVQKGIVEAIIVEGVGAGQAWHSALVLLPSDTPCEIRHVPGVAAALGVLEVEAQPFKKRMLNMDDLIDRLWVVPTSSEPFRTESWAPLLVIEDIPSVQEHGCWKTVTMWDEVARANESLIDAIAAIDGTEKPLMRLAKSRLRSLGLPTSEEAYKMHRIMIINARIKNK